MGTRYQLYPKLIYGAVAITHNPDKLETAFQLVWYSLLPSLRVDRHITKEFRTLPIRFQGLALPNPNINVLSSKIHLLREHWGRRCDVIGNMLAAAFLVFQTEVGIGGDILTCLYGSYGFLASHGFFKNLWQLLSRYGVSLRMPQSANIPLLRVDNRPLMDAVTAMGTYTPAELIKINRFQHYKCVYLVANMVCYDGLTIKLSMLMMTAGASSRQFPLHPPVRSNLALWKRAVGLIMVSGACLRIPLGAFVGVSHRPDVWFANVNGSYIYHMPVTGPPAVYE
jgi:hypothetical protein